VEFLIVLAILLVVVAVIGAPLRREWAEHADARRRAPDLDPAHELAELEAARDAKYREIRDADLDHRTGKLSDEDYEAVDRALRAEAIELLRAVDEAEKRLGTATIERQW
jgi:Na+-transporting methylmalonyl-CoA/oxaloacetate decarboxylase gamma subunit